MTSVSWSWTRSITWPTDSAARCGKKSYPPPQRCPSGIAERQGLQRRGVRRLAGHCPRTDRRNRLRTPPGAPVAARHGGPEDRRPVAGDTTFDEIAPANEERSCRRHHRARDRSTAVTVQLPGQAGFEVNPELLSMARAESQMNFRGRFGHGGRNQRHAQRNQRSQRDEPQGGQRSPVRKASRPRSSPAWTGRTCCRPSRSSSPAPAAMRPWPSASRPDSG